MRTMTATDARNNFNELISLAETEPVSITRNGQVVATLVSAATRWEGAKSSDDTTIARLLNQYSKGSIDRSTVQDETGLSFGEILLWMGALGLSLPVVRTFDRYTEKQKEMYHEVFKR